MVCMRQYADVHLYYMISIILSYLLLMELELEFECECEWEWECESISWNYER